MTCPYTPADLMLQMDDTCLHELVRGEIPRVPPKGKHGNIEARMVAAIDRRLYRAEALGWDESQGMEARDLLVGRVDSGEAGIRFCLPDDPDQVRGIDVGYLTTDQVARHRTAGKATSFSHPIKRGHTVSSRRLRVVR